LKFVQLLAGNSKPGRFTMEITKFMTVMDDLARNGGVVTLDEALLEK